MKQMYLTLLMIVALIGSDAFARGSSSGGRSSSFSSKSSSSSFSSPKSSGSSFSSPKSSPSVSSSPTRQTTKQSNFKTATAVGTGAAVGATVASTNSKPVAISNNKADAKMAKINAQKNNDAGKMYGSKKQAEASYATKLANENKYTSATPPSSRPAYIPQSTNVGGKTVNVTYNRFPGGGYGYGYYDPMTHAFMAMAATNMIVTAAMLSDHGYGHYDTHGAPVVIQAPVVHSGPSPLSVFFSIMGICLLVAILVFIIIKANE